MFVAEYIMNVLSVIFDFSEIFYATLLSSGVTNIGQQEPLNDNDIQLKSHMIADQHW